MEAIQDSAVYTNKSESYLRSLYCLITWKKYPKEENTWEPSFAVQNQKKLINFFHKKHLEKPTATFLPIYFILLIVRPTIKLTRLIIKQKQDRPANSASKQAKNWIFRCLWYLNNSFVILASNNKNGIELAWVKSWNYLRLSLASIKLISHYLKLTIELFLSNPYL